MASIGRYCSPLCAHAAATLREFAAVRHVCADGRFTWEIGTTGAFQLAHAATEICAALREDHTAAVRCR
jgi:hypothetical protein